MHPLVVVGEGWGDWCSDGGGGSGVVGGRVGSGVGSGGYTGCCKPISSRKAISR